MNANRPELINPPEIFYNEEEAKKYTRNSRVLAIQSQMTERAIQLLNLDADDGPQLILDLGSGSGLSGDVLSEMGHQWIGLDISRSMLDVAIDSEVEGDCFEWDLGQGLAFRTGSFDGAISISAIQWLCNADKKSHDPKKRLKIFFQSLYSVLRKGSRAVFQFYPQNSAQTNMITRAALKNGFSGGVVVDFPNSTKAKKYYLVLFAGVPDAKLPKGQTEEDDPNVPRTIRAIEREHFKPSDPKKKKARFGLKSKEWIIERKERDRRKGRTVRPSSKYTGRRRKRVF